MITYEEINLIKQYKSICLIGHTAPDADALASAVVLRNFLISQFELDAVDIFAECNSVPYSCSNFFENTQLNPTPSAYDVAIMLDSPNTERLGVYKTLFENAKLKIVIDHHQTNLFQGDLNIVEKQSSTCEIVYSILKEFNYEFSKSDMEKIYAGIITDTNHFTVGNFNKKTFAIASEIIDYVNHEEIHNQFFNTNSLKNMQLLSLSIKNITSSNSGQIIISHITHDEAKEYGATFDDFIGIINRLATIRHSLLICFIYPKNNSYYVSMRAKRKLKVSEIAKNHGGGGHDGAAAFLSDLPLTEIEEKILESFSSLLD